MTYADADGDFPRVTQLWLDLDGDGTYAPVERLLMGPIEPDALDFAAGKRYGLTLHLPPAESGALRYRFHFEDSRFVATGLPTTDQHVAVGARRPRRASPNDSRPSENRP